MTGRSGTVHRAEAALVLADGTVFEGEAIGAVPEGGVATGEAVFNTVLSGYQEVITDPSYAGQVIAFTYPHIGNYGVNPDRRRGGPAPLPRGDRARPLPTGRATGARPESLEDFLVRRAVPGITGIDTRRLTRHLRDQGAMPCAFGTAGEADAGRGGRGRPAHRRARPGVDGDHADQPSPGATGPTGWWPTTSASKRPCSASWASWPPSPWCRPRPRPTRCSASSPTGSSCPTGPGTRPPCPPSSSEIRDPGRGGHGPGVRDLPRPPAAGHRPRRLHLQAPLRPPRRQPPGAAAGHRPGRDHLAEPQLRGGRGLAGPAEITHVNLNDGVIEGLAQPRRRRCSASSTTPRPAPAPTTPATCSRSSGPLMDATGAGRRRRVALMPRRTRHRVDPGHRVGPHRHRPGLRVRLLGHPGLPGPGRGEVPGGAGQLQPGHHHDRPGHGRPHLRGAARPRRADRHHRAGAARRPAAHPRRPDRPQPDHGPGRAGRARRLRGRGDRGQRRGHRHRRGPGAVQGGHGGDRAGRARPRASPTRWTRPWPSATSIGYPDHGPAQLHPGRGRHRHRRHPRRT